MFGKTREIGKNDQKNTEMKKNERENIVLWNIVAE